MAAEQIIEVLNDIATIADLGLHLIHLSPALIYRSSFFPFLPSNSHVLRTP